MPILATHRPVPARAGRSAHPVAVRFLLAFVLLALFPGSALGHGDLDSTIPEPGSTLKKPPDHIIINFTEPPAKASVVEVTDGCKDQIVEEVDFQERTGHVYVSEGQPGKWKVSYRVVSSADGHKTTGSYGLTVSGKADCSAPSKDEPVDGKGKPGGPKASGPENEGSDESSFPIVPVAIGSAGLIALALVARRLSG